MALENIPLFSAMNDKEVKPPFHGQHHHPPFTAQEAHLLILEKVNACISEVNNFEQRVRFEMDKFMDKSDTENQGFKEAIQASYNAFLELVQKEVNNFETTMTNDFTLYRGDLEKRYSDFVTSINNAYKALENDVVEKSQEMSADYVSFKNSVNLAYQTFTSNVEEHMSAQDDKIQEAYDYLKNNLLNTVKNGIDEMTADGSLNDVLREVFGSGFNFRGSEPYSTITSMSATKGDYVYSTTDGHYYMYNGTKWCDVGDSSMMAAKFDEYVEHDSYTHVSLLNNLTLNVDNVSKVVSLTRNYDSLGLIFTPDRWTAVTADKTFNFGEYVPTSKNGYTGAVVYNVTNAAIEMREMGSVPTHLLFNSEDIILFCAFFDANNAVKYFTYEPLEYINVTDEMNKTTCKIFRRVCCVGDSYTAGYIYRNNVAYPTNENYAWPHYVSSATGNEWINCGVSGANVLTWQTHERGLKKAQEAGKVQAYVIGLGLNDSANGTDRYVTIGTPADIGTEAQTYYGGMSAIIRKLNEINPTAKIFVFTCPEEMERIAPYNEAIRVIVNTYKDTYPIHCIDLYENRSMFKNRTITNDYTGGHYTPIGYEQFAEIIVEVMSKYINDNIADFQNVSFIPYDNVNVGGIVGWENGYFDDDGNRSHASTAYINTTIVTSGYIPSSVRVVKCDSPYFVRYFQYKEDGTFVGFSDKSRLHVIPDDNYKYKLQVRRWDADVTNDNIYPSDSSAIHLIEGEFDTKYGRSAYFAPFKNIPSYYKGYQDNYGRFNRETTTSELYVAFDELIKASGGYITKRGLGVDSSGENYVIRLDCVDNGIDGSVTDRTNKPKIMIVAGQHGGEKCSSFSLYYWLKDLIENWSKNGLLEYVRYHCHLVIIPVANPWGFDNVSYRNANNVNLNRNYEYGWYDAGDWGDAPLSEIETQIIADQVLRDRSIMYLADFHCNGDGTSLTEGGRPNWHSQLQTYDPVHDSLGTCSKNHIDNISRHWWDEYPFLNKATYGTCGSIDTGYWETGLPTLQGYASRNGIIANTFEGLNGFTGREAFGAEGTEACTKLIGNWIPAVLMHYAKYFDISLFE